MTARAFTLLRSFLALLLLCSFPVLAADDGDQWEVTTKMTMQGMDLPMGAQTHKVCAPKEWDEPPGGASGPGGKCTVSDVQKTATKVTWKMNCAGPPAMTGEGEIVRDGDSAYSGTVKFAMDGGAMIMKMDGRRLGSCTVAR